MGRHHPVIPTRPPFEEDQASSARHGPCIGNPRELFPRRLIMPDRDRDKKSTGRKSNEEDSKSSRGSQSAARGGPRSEEPSRDSQGQFTGGRSSGKEKATSGGMTKDESEEEEEE